MIYDERSITVFKPNCKCINCEHQQDGIYFQRNECYKRVEMEIAQAIDAAEDLKDYEIYSWLKKLYKNIHIFEKYYK